MNISANITQFQFAIKPAYFSTTKNHRKYLANDDRRAL